MKLKRFGSGSGEFISEEKQPTTTSTLREFLGKEYVTYKYSYSFGKSSHIHFAMHTIQNQTHTTSIRHRGSEGEDIYSKMPTRQ